MGRHGVPQSIIITDEENKRVKLDPNSSIPASIKDIQDRDLILTDVEGSIVGKSVQCSVPVVEGPRKNTIQYFPLELPKGMTFLTASPVINSNTIEVATPTTIVLGDSVTCFQNREPGGLPHIFRGIVLNIFGGILTVHSLVSLNFNPLQTMVLIGGPQANVDGSVTKRIFTLNNVTSDLILNITNFRVHITDNLAMDDGGFGGMSALLYGVVLRKLFLDGTYVNYWDFRTNGDIALASRDLVYRPKGLGGDFALSANIPIGGIQNSGGILSLKGGEVFQLVVQDDLTPLVSFRIHVSVYVEEVS